MKKILFLLVFLILSCGDVSKIPVYSINDTRPMVYLKEAEKPSVVGNYVIASLYVYNHSYYDLNLTVQCKWYAENTFEKVAYDCTKVKVDSGTKKKIFMSDYILSETPFCLTIKCEIIGVEIISNGLVVPDLLFQF